MRRSIRIMVLPVLAALMVGICAGCGDDGINDEYTKLQTEYSELQSQYDELKDKYDSLYAENESGKAELEKVKADAETLDSALGSVSPAELETIKTGLSGSYEFTYTPPVTAAPATAATAYSSSASSASDSAQYSYIGNKNSHKFHRPTCSTLPNPENRVYFSSRDEAIDQGYDACKRCNP